MPPKSRPGNQRSPGTITVKCLGETECRSRCRRGPGIRVRHDEYEWTPPADLPGPLPDHGKFKFDVYTADDKIRRFVPRDGFRLAVARGFQIGHSLLARERSFDWPKWCHYLVAKLAFDRLSHVQERLSRAFRSGSSLTTSKLARALVGTSDILPEDLGFTGSGLGEKWWASDVLKYGDEAARADGIEAPTVSQQIVYGLLAAAMRNPLVSLPPAKIEALVQMSLYDFSRVGPRTTAELQQEVWNRFHDLVREHLYEDQETFQRWLAGGHSNLPKAVATKAGQAKLDPTIVRRALLDIGWRAYPMVAECLEEFAKAFSRALVRPLSRAERSYFSAIYYRQPSYGGLVLPLLLDRSELIQPIVVQLWEDPENTKLVGALHRMLWYYSDMARRSREADRLAKQNVAQTKITQGEDASETKERPVVSSCLSGAFRELLERREIRCPICGQGAMGELSDGQFEEGQPIKIFATCADHNWSTVLEVTWNELAAVIHQLAGSGE